ncbi:MAG TPA: uroporphyrinogen decarboxylase [Terriglobia bacterium]|nr:uroporphyrinogen decarboxylase [Terriglobia bacterium]
MTGQRVHTHATNRQTTLAAWHNSRFMRACRREPVDVTPVWLMRQAGRYMKKYRELRARVPFLELCKSPDLVTEITVSAAEKLGVDAAILFADLLLIVEPLGFELEYEKGEGPQVRPAIRTLADVDRMREVEPEALDYVFEGIRRTRAALKPDLPLLGFAAAPFTLASYLIEGGGSRSYTRTKAFMYSDPGGWRALMERLARNLVAYVRGQVEAGVQAVQIFDTWVGCLGPADYREFVLPWSRALFEALPGDIPLIHFGTGTGTLLEGMREAGGNVIGLDFHVELDAAWRRVGYDVAVQGNLDPSVLLADRSVIRARVERILQQAGRRPGHVFNLGHGILPDTPYENVTALVGMVHELSGRGSPL